MHKVTTLFKKYRFRLLLLTAGVRSFIANKGNMVYIGEVLGATMEQGAHVLKALSMITRLIWTRAGQQLFGLAGHTFPVPEEHFPMPSFFSTGSSI